MKVASATLGGTVLRLLSIVGLVVATLFGSALSGAHEGEPTRVCREAEPVPDEEEVSSHGTLRVEVQHRGLASDMTICVLDAQKRNVAHMSGRVSGNAVVLLEAELAFGEYTTVVEADARGIVGGGSFVLQQPLDLRACDDATVARARSHHYPWGSGIEGAGVDCAAASDASPQAASTRRPVPLT